MCKAAALPQLVVTLFAIHIARIVLVFPAWSLVAFDAFALFFCHCFALNLKDALS